MTQPHRNLRLRPVTPQDAELLFLWANDRTVREQSISTEPISWTEHTQWLEGVLGDSDRRLYLLEVNGHPVGQIRFDCQDATASVNISIEGEHRGEGLGELLIAMGTSRARKQLDVDRFVALIRPENRPSQQAFKSVGFQFTGREERGGITLLRYVLGKAGTVHLTS